MDSRMQRIERYASQYCYSKLSNSLNVAYGIANPGLRSLLIKPLHKMIQAHNLFSVSREGHAYRVQGISTQNGQPMKVAFLGNWSMGQHNTLLFYQHLLFKENTAEMEDCGPVSMANIRQQAEFYAREADLIAIDMNHLLAWRPAAGDWVIGPNGIRMVLDFQPGETWQSLSRRIGTQTGNMRVMRKTKYSYRITHADEDFNDFYYAMHVPMVQNRHRGYGDLLKEEGLRHVFKKGGFLIQILDQENQVVAAGLETVSSRVLFGLVNGVRGGDQELTKKGAVMAIYYYSMQWALKNGIRRFDSGVCPPFTTSGLYQHKRSWRFEPELNYWKPYSVMLWAPGSAPNAVEWMKANPIVPRFSRWGGNEVKAAYDVLLQMVPA